MAHSHSAAHHKQQVGQLAEKLVARWLRQQGWTILHERWHCRWGEIDVIAHPPAHSAAPVLVFVEVKARGDRNWDEDGLLAITPQKQAKLWRTAELFLAQNPAMADWDCRFDVALVKSAIAPRLGSGASPSGLLTIEQAIDQLPNIEIGQTVKIQGYYLKIQQYLAAVIA